MASRYGRRRYNCPRPNTEQLDQLIGDLQGLVETCVSKAGSYYPNNLFQEGKIQLCYVDRNGRRQCELKTIPINLIDLKKRADECENGNQNSCRLYTDLYFKLIDYMERLTDALRRSVPVGATKIGIRVLTRCLPKRPQPGQGYLPGYGTPIRLL